MLFNVTSKKKIKKNKEKKCVIIMKTRNKN